jgi:hypothetical protein
MEPMYQRRRGLHWMACAVMVVLVVVVVVIAAADGDKGGKGSPGAARKFNSTSTCPEVIEMIHPTKRASGCTGESEACPQVQLRLVRRWGMGANGSRWAFCGWV